MYYILSFLGNKSNFNIDMYQFPRVSVIVLHKCYMHYFGRAQEFDQTITTQLSLKYSDLFLYKNSNIFVNIRRSIQESVQKFEFNLGL